MSKFIVSSLLLSSAAAFRPMPINGRSAGRSLALNAEEQVKSSYLHYALIIEVMPTKIRLIFAAGGASKQRTLRSCIHEIIKPDIILTHHRPLKI